MDRCFLCFRQQRVAVKGACIKSDWSILLFQVSQSAMFLAPFCSICACINDITSDIETEIRLFADDCVCYRAIKNKEDTLKHLKDILISFFRQLG